MYSSSGVTLLDHYGDEVRDFDSEDGARTAAATLNAHGLDFGDVNEWRHGWAIIYENDEWVGNPRSEWGHQWTWAASHRCYTIGGSDDEVDPTVERLNEIIAMGKRGEALVVPLWGLDHSVFVIRTGTAFSRNANPFWEDPGQWDSGLLGVAFVMMADIRKEWKAKRVSARLRATVLKNLEYEVEEYNQWATGDVWSASVYGPESDDRDSCGGLFGRDRAEEWAREEGVDTAIAWRTKREAVA